ncbi:LON peptidase substrate-binding domain-containing protein [Rhodovibrionaceae bacterium A322]
MSHGPFDPDFSDLPETLAVFPLPGALLLPGNQMSLNIFEPRYLAMVEDALKDQRLIGMIQPKLEEGTAGSDVGAAPLYELGCVGRISGFNETQDRRYLINLSGLCRFRGQQELDQVKGYRRLAVSWDGFSQDMAPEEDADIALPRTRLLEALQRYLEQQEMNADLEALNAADDLQIVDTLAMACPFSVAEKQALLEAATAQERTDTLIAIMEMAILNHNEGTLRH